MELIVLDKKQFKEELMRAWVNGWYSDDINDNSKMVYAKKRCNEVKFCKFV